MYQCLLTFYAESYSMKAYDKGMFWKNNKRFSENGGMQTLQAHGGVHSDKLE